MYLFTQLMKLKDVKLAADVSYIILKTKKFVQLHKTVPEYDQQLNLIYPGKNYIVSETTAQVNNFYVLDLYQINSWKKR